MSSTNPRTIYGQLLRHFLLNATKLCSMLMGLKLCKRAMIIWRQEADWLFMVCDWKGLSDGGEDGSLTVNMLGLCTLAQAI